MWWCDVAWCGCVGGGMRCHGGVVYYDDVGGVMRCRSVAGGVQEIRFNSQNRFSIHLRI